MNAYLEYEMGWGMCCVDSIAMGSSINMYVYNVTKWRTIHTLINCKLIKKKGLCKANILKTDIVEQRTTKWC